MSIYKQFNLNAQTHEATRAARELLPNMGEVIRGSCHIGDFNEVEGDTPKATWVVNLWTNGQYKVQVQGVTFSRLPYNYHQCVRILARGTNMYPAAGNPQENMKLLWEFHYAGV